MVHNFKKVSKKLLIIITNYFEVINYFLIENKIILLQGIKIQIHFSKVFMGHNEKLRNVIMRKTDTVLI